MLPSEVADTLYWVVPRGTMIVWRHGDGHERTLSGLITGTERVSPWRQDSDGLTSQAGYG